MTFRVTTARARGMLQGMREDDTPRAVEAAMMYGRIASVDGKTCRVESGGVLTDAVLWNCSRAGAVRRWCPPTIGEQVMLLCPGGDTHGATALCGLSSDAFDAPSDDMNLDLTLYPDGTRVSYNFETHRLEAVIEENGEAFISAKKLRIESDVEITGKVNIVGDVSIDGDADASGTVSGTADVVGAGKSLKNHKHTGVNTGGGVSGPPQ